MGELYVSASEIESFDLCPRFWAFKYIEKKRPPPNDSAALGTRVHAILEKWLKDGTAPDTWTPEGEIAASGLHLLPAPRTPTLVTEEPFYFTSRRAWYFGVKDFQYRDADGLLRIGDHKTTKSFTWAKSTDEILAHSQALIYAVSEFHRNPNDDRLSLDWIYYKTTGSRKAELRSQIVTRDVVAEMFFEHVDPVAGEITKLHHEVPVDASALDFTPDFRACDAFGGCAFLSICNPTPTQRVQANMTQANLSLADKLKSMKAGRAPSPIHPPEAFAAPAPVVALPMFQAAPVVPSFQSAPVVPSVTAPSVPSFNLPVPASQAPALAFPLPPTVVQAAPSPTPEGPKKRGPKKKTAAVAAPVAPDAPAQAAWQPPSGPSPTLPTPPTAHAPGFTLYIGCAPIGCEVTNALDYVMLAQRDNHKAGGGQVALCDVLDSLLTSTEVVGLFSGDVLLGNTQLEQDTLGVWLSRASKVVRAFR